MALFQRIMNARGSSHGGHGGHGAAEYYMFDGHYYVKKNWLFTFGLSFWLLLPRFAFTRPPQWSAQ